MTAIEKKTRAVELPTKFGNFRAISYQDDSKGEHLALIKHDVKGQENVLVRIHSQCLTGDTLGSLRCDCGEQLEQSFAQIKKEGGVLIYLAQEGRGIGLFNKITAYTLQDQGMDTVEANIKLGFGEDDREYGIAAEILKDIGVSTVRLLTNNPKKLEGLTRYGIRVVERVPIVVEPNAVNQAYLRTKQKKLGHQLERQA